MSAEDRIPREKAVAFFLKNKEGGGSAVVREISPGIFGYVKRAPL